MKEEQYVPEQGDLIWTDFDPRVGHEQSGHRPALVLSAGQYNRVTGMMMACPITSQDKQWPLRVALPADCAITGFVISDGLRQLDWRARGAKYAGAAPKAVIQEVCGKLGAVIPGLLAT